MVILQEGSVLHLTHISTTNAPCRFFPYWIFTLRSIDRGIKFDSTPTGSRSYGTCRRAYNKRQTVSLVFCRRESAQKAKNEDAADHLSIIGRSQYSALVRALNSACCASRAPNGSIHCRFSLHFPCKIHMILPLSLPLSLSLSLPLPLPLARLVKARLSGAASVEASSTPTLAASGTVGDFPFRAAAGL